MSSVALQLDSFPTEVYLRRVEPDPKQLRFFQDGRPERSVWRCSFNYLSVRFGTYGREKIDRHADAGRVISALVRIAQMKRRGGYRLCCLQISGLA
jgi:hypothetical protein